MYSISAQSNTHKTKEKRGVLTFVRAHWGKIFLLAVLVLIIAANYRYGKVIIGNDNFSPELNPQLTIERSIFSPAWRDYRSQGIASDTEQSDLFRTAVFALLEKVMPTWAVSQFAKFLPLFCGPWFMAWLARALAKRHFRDINLELVFLVSGLTYLFSMQTLSVYYYLTVLFIAAYGFLPPLLLYSYLYLQEGKWRYVVLFAISALFLATAALTMTLFIVVFGLWVLMIFFFWMITTKKVSRWTKLKRVVSLGLLWISLSFYWLAPFGYYLLHNAQAVQDSYINRVVTPNFVENERSANNLENTLHFYFNWRNSMIDGKTVSFAGHDFYNEPIINAISYLPLVFLLAGTGYLLYKRKYNFLILFCIFTLGVFLIAGDNTPAAPVLELLRDKVPLLRQALRWQSSKLWPLMLIPLALLAPFGVIALEKALLSSKLTTNTLGKVLLKPLFLIALAGIGIGSFIMFGLPFFQGQLIFHRYYLEIPQNYYELKKQLGNSPQARIYMAPEASTLYFHNLDWSAEGEPFSSNTGPGFWGSSFLNYLIPNKLVDKTFAIGSAENDRTFRDINTAFYTDNQQLFSTALTRYDVDLVLLDKSHSSIYPGYSYDYELVYRQIADNPNFQKVWEDGFLSLYAVRAVVSAKATEASSVPVQEAKFVYSGHEVDHLSALATSGTNAQLNNRIISTDYGSVYPLALNPEGLGRDGNSINFSHKYTGQAQAMRLEYTDRDLSNYPSELTLSGQTLSLGPSLPDLRVNDKPLFIKPKLTSNINFRPQFLQAGQDLVQIGSAKEQTFGFNSTLEAVSKGVYAYDNENSSQNLMGLFNGKVATRCYEGTQFGTVRQLFDRITLPSSSQVACAGIDFKVKANSVLEFDLGFSSQDLNQLTICIWSTRDQRCLNHYATTLVQDAKVIKFVVEEVTSDENIQFHLRWQNLAGTDTSLTLKQLRLNTYSKRQKLDFDLSKLQALRPNLPQIVLEPGAEIKVSMPLLSGKNTYTYGTGSLLKPEFEYANCHKPGSGNTLDLAASRYFMQAKDCIISFFPLHRFNFSSVLNIVYFDGNNTRGLPIDIGLTEKKNVALNREAYQQRTPYLSSERGLDFVVLPKGENDYYFTAKSAGFAKMESINQLNDLLIMNIPSQWLNISLQPVASSASTKPEQLKRLLPNAQVVPGSQIYRHTANAAGEIVSLGQASAAGWMIINTDTGDILRNSEVEIDNWEQGFILPTQGNYVVLFWPNLLAYFGYFLATTTLFVLILWTLASIWTRDWEYED